MKIYAACLASYNNGNLFGRWIDIDGKDSDEIREEIAAMLRESPVLGAEEWAIHDYEDFPSIFGEWPDLDILAKYAAAYTEHGTAWELYFENEGAEHADPDEFADRFQGEFESIEDWAIDYLEEAGIMESVPESLRSYIDYEAYARDCQLGGDIWIATRDGKVYVYNNN